MMRAATAPRLMRTTTPADILDFVATSVLIGEGAGIVVEAVAYTSEMSFSVGSTVASSVDDVAALLADAFAAGVAVQ